MLNAEPRYLKTIQADGAVAFEVWKKRVESPPLLTRSGDRKHSCKLVFIRG